MNAVFRYPIFDFRTLYSFKETNKMFILRNKRFNILNDWPHKCIHFIKYTGNILIKNKKYKYSSKRGIRFPNLSKYAFKEGKTTIVPQVKHRFFTPKNMFISSYEVEFFNRENIYFDEPILIERVIKHFRCIIAKTYDCDNIKLQDSASYIHSLYYTSLTRVGKINKIKNWLLKKIDHNSCFTKKDINKLIKGRPVAVFTFKSSRELLTSNFENICTIENITIFRYKIEGRMNIWIINPKDNKNKKLVELIKNYILDTEQVSQNIEYIAKYINENQILKYNENAKNKILRMSTHRFFEKGYFVINGKYIEEQRKIRYAILNSIQINNLNNIQDFLNIKNVHLKWKTLFMICNLETWELISAMLFRDYPEQSVQMNMFFNAMRNKKYDEAVKLINNNDYLKIFSKIIVPFLLKISSPS